MAKKPIDQFVVGDFITAEPWRFPLKITKIDSGNGQFETIKADGYDDKDIYYIVPESAVLFEKYPKFKVGEKIVNPTTQNGGNLGGSAKTLIEKSNNENLGYLVITNVTYNRYLDNEFSYWLGFLDLPNASVSFNDEDKLELYRAMPDKPEPKFKVGDIVKSIDGKEFRQYEILTVNFRIFYFYYVKRVGTEAYVTYTESELELISKAPIDCEADPSLIVSGQVKKFYDLNKPRIEKLKSEFSCKIIKALVSLSDYEKCGTPSKIKLPTAKEDLLSEIKNLKF